MFPLSIKGKVIIPPEEGGADIDLNDKIVVMLRRVKAANIQIQANTISFRGGFLSPVFGNWNILLGLGSGTIETIENTEGQVVFYRLSTVENLLIPTIMVSY